MAYEVGQSKIKRWSKVFNNNNRYHKLTHLLPSLLKSGQWVRLGSVYKKEGQEHLVPLEFRTAVGLNPWTDSHRSYLEKLIFCEIEQHRSSWGFRWYLAIWPKGLHNENGNNINIDRSVLKPLFWAQRIWKTIIMSAKISTSNLFLSLYGNLFHRIGERFNCFKFCCAPLRGTIGALKIYINAICFRSVFSIPKSIQATVTLLENLHIILEKTPRDDIRTEVLPMLYNAFESTTIQVQVSLTLWTTVGILELVKKMRYIWRI